MPVRTHRAPRPVLLATVTAAALAATAVPATAQAHDPHARTHAAVDALVRDGAPGVVARSEGRGGSRPWTDTAGVGDLTTGRERDPRDRFRIGSLTKTFTATVVLQLEAEGRLSLDDRVEKWLPGLVRGNGHDGSGITLRQLLQHTSGIHDYTSDPKFVSERMTVAFLDRRYESLPARGLVKIAMNHAPDFEPGTKWGYSNTNYLLAGLVIEKVTRHSYESEIDRRILRPLALRATSVPHDEPRLPRPSSRAYTTFGEDPATAKKYDVTELNPTLAGAAGGMVSSTADLTRFYRALLTGKLLPKRQLAEMKTTVPMSAQRPDLAYGLGIYKEEQSCGKVMWGHTGGIHGSTTHAVASEDGGKAVALNLNGDWSGDTDTVMEAEFCPK